MEDTQQLGMWDLETFGLCQNYETKNKWQYKIFRLCNEDFHKLSFCLQFYILLIYNDIYKHKYRIKSFEFWWTLNNSLPSFLALINVFQVC